MVETEFYDINGKRRCAVNFGRFTGEVAMYVDDWEKLCNLILYEIRQDRASQKSAQQAVGADARIGGVEGSEGTK